MTENLPIRHYGDPVLRHPAEPIREITPEVRDFAQQMIAAMYGDDGIGLAAPQVGRSSRLITLATRREDTPPPADASPGECMLWQRMPVALVNPVIVSLSDEQATAEEGCLSVPGIYGNVTRPARVVLRAMLLSGETIQLDCGGLLARCLQHEIDHLDGTLFVDRMSDEDRRRVRSELRQLEKATRRRLRKGGA
jgi:peptide deformylase